MDDIRALLTEMGKYEHKAGIIAGHFPVRVEIDEIHGRKSKPDLPLKQVNTGPRKARAFGPRGTRNF